MKLTEIQIAEINRQLDFKKKSIREWVNNSSKWDRWGNTMVPLAEAKKILLDAIDKEFRMSMPYEENENMKKLYIDNRDRLVYWIDEKFIKGRIRMDLGIVANKVQNAMDWLYEEVK